MNGGEVKKGGDEVDGSSEKQLEVLMCGYFPGVTAQRSPLTSPVSVRFPEADASGDSWKDVCAGGCGFGVAISASGKLVTWGSSDDQGQSYLASGKHGETPEVYPLATTNPIVEAAAGWAHCVSVTDKGEVYTWGWKECVPSVKIARNWATIKQCEDETVVQQSSLLTDQDVGQVWGWGYGGEGQLGLGSRIKMVASPHLIPCIDPSSMGGVNSGVNIQKSVGAAAEHQKSIGNYIKSIACGGRHSVVVTDIGVLLAFGWGLYGQCGQGNTDDLLRPTCVPSLTGSHIKSIAAGLWHTICVCSDGRVHVFGGNQFGQLGLGTHPDQCEIVPRLVDASVLDSKKAKTASSGARHSAILTEDGKIFCWGWNKYGQLGVGDAVDRNMPEEVTLERDYVAKNIACGWWHTLLLCEKIQSN